MYKIAFKSTLFQFSFLIGSLCLTGMGCTEWQEKDQVDSNDKGFVASQRLWSSLRIPVCWENQDQIDQEHQLLVQNAILETWSKAVPFEFFGWNQCKSESRGIRILSADSHPHVLGLGNYIDGRPNGMLLNFDFKRFSPICGRSESERNRCIRVIAVHEFGHALGLDHEQERDDTPDWCRENHRQYGLGGDWIIGEWDLDSVMNYCNPEWSGNGILSGGDIRTLQIAYAHLLDQLQPCGYVRSEKRFQDEVITRSCNGEYSAVQEKTGNLVIYNADKTAIWSTQTQGWNEAWSIFQEDGNLVVYDVQDRPLWKSKTAGFSKAQLTLEDHGSLFISNQHQILWRSDQSPSMMMIDYERDDSNQSRFDFDDF